MFALPALLRAQSVNKGIEGSPHDFSTNSLYSSWNTRRGVCSACHQAHHTDDAQLIPLWNHATSTAGFIPYSSPTLDASVGSPKSVSLACLSCHDGSLAINQGISGPLGGTSTAPTQKITDIEPEAQIGPDLHTTHPVSFTYDSALAALDGGLEDPAVYTIGSPKTNLTVSVAPVPASWSGTSLSGKTIKDAMLFGAGKDQMECSSCHDVHKLEGSSPSSGILVRVSGNDATGRGSTLCRTCHIK